MKKIMIMLTLIFTVSVYGKKIEVQGLGKPPKLNWEKIERWTAFYWNVVRVNHNRKSLTYRKNNAFQDAARWHADYCAKHDILEHVIRASGYETPSSRIMQFQYKRGEMSRTIFVESLAVVFAANSEYRVVREEYNLPEKGEPIIKRKFKNSKGLHWRNEKEVAYMLVNSFKQSPKHLDALINPDSVSIVVGVKSGYHRNHRAYFATVIQTTSGAKKLPKVKIKKNKQRYLHTVYVEPSKKFYPVAVAVDVENTVIYDMKQQSKVKYKFLCPDARIPNIYLVLTDGRVYYPIAKLNWTNNYVN
jgi:hypothetical protein